MARLVGLVVVVVVLLVTGGLAGGVSSGWGPRGGVVELGEERILGVVKQEESDPCAGKCDANHDCVVTNSGSAFCVNCGGILKPKATGSRFAECCRYNAVRRKCVPALGATSTPGNCLRTDELFARIPTNPLTLEEDNDTCSTLFPANPPTDINSSLCYSSSYFRSIGLACKVETTADGKVQCVNGDGTVDDPVCTVKYQQLGLSIPGENPEDLSGFGLAASADGLRVAIGARHNSDGGFASAGHLRVYEYRNEWMQVGQDIDGIGERDFFGTSVAMSDDGLRIAIGAFFASGSTTGSATGQVQVYEFVEGEGWMQLGQNIYGDATGVQAGKAVAMSSDGSRVAITSLFGSFEGAGGAGQVKVYELSENELWRQLGEDIYGEAEGERMGQSVAMTPSGQRFAVGGSFRAGIVRVYDFLEGEGWIQVGQSIVGTTLNEASGYSVALSADGSRLAVGVPLYTVEGNADVGQVRVYDFQEGEGWVKVGQFINGKLRGGEFGYSLTLSDDGQRLAVGSPRIVESGTGYVEVYQLQNDEWLLVSPAFDGELSNGFFGFAVAMSSDGSLILVSAPGSDANGSRSGKVVAFEAVSSAFCD